MRRALATMFLVSIALLVGVAMVMERGSPHAVQARDGVRTFVPPPGGVITNTVYLPFVVNQSPESPPGPVYSHHLYLPLVIVQPPPDINPARAPRMGFGSHLPPLEFPTIRELNAGWYVNWNTNATPQRPGAMDFVQTVRLHQKTECGSRVTPDRVACPYVVPHEYEFNDVDEAQINRIARFNPASTWLIGNECDRRDWVGGGQDEILPELYVHAYHQAYNWIKAADPTAKVAICGLIQASPLRLQYLARVWSAYEAEFGVTMPVDVWNIHLFAIREVAGDWGADIPVGIEGVSTGAFLDWKNTHINMDVFAKQIRDFRQFMVDRGQIDKPLIVTEYGVLFGEEDFPQTDVHNYMVATFEHMMDTTDCALSTVDDCRLVQRWAWFSLADIEWGFNPHTTLFDVNTKNMTLAGEKFRQFTLDNFDALQYNP